MSEMVDRVADAIAAMRNPTDNFVSFVAPGIDSEGYGYSARELKQAWNEVIDLVLK